MYFQLFIFIVGLALISNFNLLKHHNCVGGILDTPSPPSSHDPTMGGSGDVLSNFIYDVGLCHSTHTHTHISLFVKDTLSYRPCCPLWWWPPPSHKCPSFVAPGNKRGAPFRWGHSRPPPGEAMFHQWTTDPSSQEYGLALQDIIMLITLFKMWSCLPLHFQPLSRSPFYADLPRSLCEHHKGVLGS